MNTMNNLKISMKITLWAGICILFLALSIIGYSTFSMRNEAIRNAKENVSSLANEKAETVKLEIESSLYTARTLAQTLTTQISGRNQFTREQVNSVLKELLQKSPNIIGTYTLWEPNAFDGNDRNYINKSGHDNTGRFIPYWNKDSEGNIAVEALMGYAESGIGDYYQIPKQTKSETILDPYIYPIQGVDTLITSIVVPIVVDDVFYGIAGVDISLSFLQSLCDKSDIYSKTGELLLLSNNGTISGITGKSDLVGKSMQEIFNQDFNKILEIIQDSQTSIMYENKIFKLFTPINFGSTTTPWSVGIILPDDKVLERLVKVLLNLILLGALFAVIALLMLLKLSKKITDPIKTTVSFAEKVASGDLTATVDIDQEDEVGQLALALRTMIKKVSGVVRIVVTGSEQIVSASTQLAAGNQDLSSRTELQASALEETSAAIEEMNSSIRSNADNTITANKLSEEVAEKTDEGSLAVNQMIQSMNEISESSNRISDIIEVINNIAFQTNLLALNASIEAARAGEQGKGFAVVAVEVRKLAKRSDKAAAEIASIIKNSNKKVEDGVIIANNAGETLNNINQSVKKVTTLIGEISAASQEQLTSVDQIDQTLSSLDENTQKNASLVEESAASTEELSAQAVELNRNMQFFKLGQKENTEKINETRSLDYGEEIVENDPPTDNTGSLDEFSKLANENKFKEF